MTKIKIGLSFLISFFIACTIIDCSKSNDINPSSLIGTWTYTKSTYTNCYNAAPIWSCPPTDSTVCRIFNFYPNGNGLFVGSYMSGPSTYTDSAKYTYSIKGDNLTIISDGISSTYTITVSGSKMTFTYKNNISVNSNAVCTMVDALTKQ